MDPARLRSIRLFESFSDEELGKIAPFADEGSVPEGKQLVREGDFSYQLLGIEEGTAEVTRGGEHVADLGPGDFFGEIGVMERALRTASVTATAPMRVITLTSWELRRMERDLPQVLEALHQAADERRPPAVT